MPFDDASLGSFGSLAHAIGLTDGTTANSTWFKDPVGGSTDNVHGLKTVLSDDDQRAALEAFVDEALGPPERHTSGAQRWIPLFAESSPAVTVYAVLEPVAGAVRIGVGVDHTAGTPTTHVKTSVHVPIFHVPRGGADSRPADPPDLPRWLLLGRPGGRIEVSADAQFEPGPPTPGEAFLGGAAVTLAIPTTSEDQAEFSLTLRDLQLPGATTPSSRTLDITALDELGPDVFEFVSGILRQQIDSLDLTDDTFRHIRGLAGILGLHDVKDLPPLPLADLPTRGLHVLVGWIEQVLADGLALDAWLGELADLVGGSPVTARDAVEFAIGPAQLLFGLRVTPGTGDHSVLVPWAEVTWSPSDGADLSLDVDLLRADTATGKVTAVPGIRALAVLGAEAHHGAKLLTGIPGVGTIRIGIGLDEHEAPEFVLTVHDVDLPGPLHHDLLDLSSPDAALNAAGSVVTNALGAALDGFGDVGALLKELLGIQPPGGVTALSVPALLADPLAALRAYWLDLTGDSPAMGQVLGTLRRVLTGSVVAVPGLGTDVSPWLLDVADGIGLRFWRVGHVLSVGVGAEVVAPVPGDLAVATRVDLTLMQVDLDAGHVSFASRASGQVLLQPAGVARMDLSLDVATIHFSGIGVRAQWAPGVGLRAVVLSDGLTVSFTDPHTLLAVEHGMPLPVVAADGTVTFAPDWDAVG